MASSSAPNCLLLPFGALTGVIPIDAVSRSGMLGDTSSILPGNGQRASKIQQQIHSVIDPIPHVPRGRRPPARAGTAASDWPPQRRK